MIDEHDCLLIESTLQGSIDSYGELVNKYQQTVFNVCYRILNNVKDAEDQSQETFMRAYHNLEKFDLQRDFSPWIRRIASNLCLNFIKSSRKKMHQELHDESPDLLQPAINTSLQPEQQAEIRERQIILQNAIRNLSHSHRIVIELRHFQGLSYEEMAEMLDLPLNTIKSHLFRGRKILSEKLKESYYA